MAVSNIRLRDLRRRTAAPARPGMHLSRKELAEAVNRWIFESHDGRVVDLDANYIGKLERGVIRWPQPAYREALRAILGATTDTALGFAPGRRGSDSRLITDPPGTAVEIAAPSGASGDLLAELREAVTSRGRRLGPQEPLSTSLAYLESRAVECHDRYQRTDYDGAARLLPDAVRRIESLLSAGSAGTEERRLRRAQAVTYIAAAKLASRTSDHDLAWLTADRAEHAALAADAPLLAATARRQLACVFYDTGRPADAERIALDTFDSIRGPLPDDADLPDLLSVRGALLLLAAMAAVRQGDRVEARRRLAGAADLAASLGGDDNRLWSAFGPTNVAIHALGAAVALDEPAEAVAVGARIDTRTMPPPLVGRRARMHADLAAGHARLGDDAVAAVHVVDVARRAPGMLRVDGTARGVITTLLGRASGSTVSVLRGIAEQAGVA